MSSVLVTTFAPEYPEKSNLDGHHGPSSTGIGGSNDGTVRLRLRGCHAGTEDEVGAMEQSCCAHHPAHASDTPDIEESITNRLSVRAPRRIGRDPPSKGRISLRDAAGTGHPQRCSDSNTNRSPPDGGEEPCAPFAYFPPATRNGARSDDARSADRELKPAAASSRPTGTPDPAMGSQPHRSGKGTASTQGVSGRMGRLPPFVGGLAIERSGRSRRHAVTDVGARPRRKDDRGTAEVAGKRLKMRQEGEADAAELKINGTVGRYAQPCCRQSCLSAVREWKERALAAEAKLEKELRMREVEVEGAVRAARIQLGHDQMQAQIQTMQSEMLRHKRYRKSCESLNRRLKSENTELSIAVKSLSIEVEALEGMEQIALKAEDTISEAKRVTEAANRSRAEAEYIARLAERREDYAKHCHGEIKQKLKDLVPTRQIRSEAQWSQLSRWGRYKAAERDTAHIRTFLASGGWRVSEIAAALDAEGLVVELFETKPFFPCILRKWGTWWNTSRKSIMASPLA